MKCYGLSVTQVPEKRHTGHDSAGGGRHRFQLHMRDHSMSWTAHVAPPANTNKPRTWSMPAMFLKVTVASLACTRHRVAGGRWVLGRAGCMRVPRGVSLGQVGCMRELGRRQGMVDGGARRMPAAARRAHDGWAASSSRHWHWCGMAWHGMAWGAMVRPRMCAGMVTAEWTQHAMPCHAVHEHRDGCACTPWNALQLHHDSMKQQGNETFAP